MGRPLSHEALAHTHARQLLGYINNGYYDRNYNCYDRAGCLAGAIIGAVIFALIALALLTWLLLRMRRQRAAQATNYANNPQQVPQQQYAGPYPAQYGNQPQYPPQYPQQGQGPSPGPPPANMSSAEREAYEAEQYAKYGEAGVVQGYPAGPSNGVQMSQIPNKP